MARSPVASACPRSWCGTTDPSIPVAPPGRPWITVEWLPHYAPELNAIERSWRDLKRHHLAHRTFKDTTDLTATIQAAVKQLNTERMSQHPCDNLEKAA